MKLFFIFYKVHLATNTQTWSIWFLQRSSFRVWVLSSPCLVCSSPSCQFVVVRGWW